MDIKLREKLEQLEFVKEKLEYLSFDEYLGCYVEKQNGHPVGAAAWVNGAFYGFEQAAKASAVPDGYVIVPKEPTAKINNAGLHEYRKLVGFGPDDIGHVYKAMIEAAQEQE